MSRAQKRSRQKIFSKFLVAPESLASGPIVPLEPSAAQPAPETFTLLSLEVSTLIPVTLPPVELTMSPRPGVSHVIELVAPTPVNCMLTIGPGPGINSEALELVEPTPVAQESLEGGIRRVEPIFQPLKRKRGFGGTSKEVVQSAISLPSAFEMAEPVSPSTRSPMTCQVDHPSQPIVRESGPGEILQANMIPISPPPLGFATEVSSSPEGQNIRRRITPSTPVAPLTCFVPIKPTTRHYCRSVQADAGASKNPYPSFKTDHHYRREAQADGNRSKTDPCRSSIDQARRRYQSGRSQMKKEC